MREVLMTNRRAAARSLEGARAATAGSASRSKASGGTSPRPRDGLLAVGDAAAFIDPFTGSGMLMALESGELAARSRLALAPRRRGTATLSTRSRATTAQRYDERFGARLRLCGWLRRAAFAPRALAESAVLALGASARAAPPCWRAPRAPAAASKTVGSRPVGGRQLKTG